MTPADLDLARRAVACPRWRWMPGMCYIVPRAAPMEPIFGRVPDLTRGWTAHPGMLPVLTDPATLGCVMALYEETRETLCCPDPVYTLAAAWGLAHPRTIEALIAALEASP